MSSSQQFKAGQAHGQGMEKADQWVHSATDTTHEAAQSVRENKEHTTGMMQQVGEQARNMAHNAVESMKHTMGVDKNHK
ncbi:hypothetical protein HPP92_008331 [Vanilla planifolia]|uniref:Uncharacterized protein n=1 Tax=Vanilla planifolia TaxID=51239 RepID=A0A835V7T3_VANPL|nr:hypothetical protein HPP92_008331 [Vanilla planifolia]